MGLRIIGIVNFLVFVLLMVYGDNSSTTHSIAWTNLAFAVGLLYIDTRKP